MKVEIHFRTPFSKYNKLQHTIKEFSDAIHIELGRNLIGLN